MFSGNMKLLLSVLGILLGLFIISKLKILILIISWAIIIICLCILYAKSHPENIKFNRMLNNLITKILNSKVYKYILKMKEKFFK